MNTAPLPALYITAAASVTQRAVCEIDVKSL
jgi:hypothetical protein